MIPPALIGLMSLRGATTKSFKSHKQIILTWITSYITRFFQIPTNKDDKSVFKYKNIKIKLTSIEKNKY